jgi:hypothetical protein
MTGTPGEWEGDAREGDPVRWYHDWHDGGLHGHGHSEAPADDTSSEWKMQLTVMRCGAVQCNALVFLQPALVVGAEVAPKRPSTKIISWNDEVGARSHERTDLFP